MLLRQKPEQLGLVLKSEVVNYARLDVVKDLNERRSFVLFPLLFTRVQRRAIE